MPANSTPRPCGGHAPGARAARSAGTPPPAARPTSTIPLRSSIRTTSSTPAPVPTPRASRPGGVATIPAALSPPGRRGRIRSRSCPSETRGTSTSQPEDAQIAMPTHHRLLVTAPACLGVPCPAGSLCPTCHHHEIAHPFRFHGSPRTVATGRARSNRFSAGRPAGETRNLPNPGGGVPPL
jgi:hypothetical protein